MPLCLVLHDLPSGGAEVLEAAIWEVSESHWVVAANTLFVSSDVSVNYLSDHLRGALRRSGMQGWIMVLQAASDVVSAGLGEDAQAWLREQSPVGETTSTVLN